MTCTCFSTDGAAPRRGLLALLVLAALSAGAPTAGGGPYDLLRRITSPQEMARRCMPGQYVVPVTLTGDMADQIRRTLAAQGLPEPRFEEWMDHGAFSLLLVNDDYAIDTRDLVTGILNPLDMMAAIVESVLRYGRDDAFRELVKETNIAVRPVGRGGGAVVAATLSPKGQRFGYTYEDLGTHVHESWLVGLEAVMDTVADLVLEITQQRRVREYGMQQAAKPPVKEVLARYRFSYDSSSGHPLPSLLELALNDTPRVVIAARYRQEGRHVVFDWRAFGHIRGSGDTAYVVLHYGAYNVGLAARALAVRAGKKSAATARIERAAELSREAAREIRAGQIRSSLRTLRRLVDDYPDTPQAIEARKLLDGLPEGL